MRAKDRFTTIRSVRLFHVPDAWFHGVVGIQSCGRSVTWRGGAWTPHWWRHTHATALLLSEAHEHVVMRRMGHADVHTTLTLYSWVTEDAKLKTLANWKPFTTNWRGLEESSARPTITSHQFLPAVRPPRTSYRRAPR